MALPTINMDSEDQSSNAGKDDKGENPPDMNESESNGFINFNEYKAGLGNLDKERINKIIQEASKGSPYYMHQQNRQKKVDLKVARLKNVLEFATEIERKEAMEAADAAIADLETRRTLNRIMVHFDMDMFFAAVEIKKNPQLADKPVAVGGLSMISTSNYVARRFGVRSAMAGFIAKRLCPQLILIRPNFRDYKRESKNVMDIISEYDPNDMSCLSLDEVHIDLTDYVFEKYSRESSIDLSELYMLTKLPDEIWTFAYEQVEQIRSRIFAETKLTVSAGIASNTALAKLCTDINKPNGQFLLKGDKDEILKMTMDLPIRKFFGIGPVTGQLLNGLNICKGKDIVDRRDDLVIIFSEQSAKHFLRTALGIGSSFISNDRQQKSYSSERTVGDLNNFADMCSLLKKTSQHVANDLKSNEQVCKTVTVKLKNVKFETNIKSKTLNTYVDDEETILKTATDLLSQEMAKSPSTRYRLLGVKVSNLKDKKDADKPTSKQLTVTQFFHTRSENSETSEQISDNDSSVHSEVSSNYKCRFCNRAFEHCDDFEMHRMQCEECNTDLSEDFLIELDRNEWSNSAPGSELNLSASEHNSIDQTEANTSSSSISSFSNLRVECPVCQLSFICKNNFLFNEHLDNCLNKSCLRELSENPVTPVKQSPPPKTVAKSKTVSKPKTGSQPKRKMTPSNKKSKKQKSNVEDTSQLKIDQFFSKK